MNIFLVTNLPKLNKTDLIVKFLYLILWLKNSEERFEEKNNFTIDEK
jgi:hypothetical protein